MVWEGCRPNMEYSEFYRIVKGAEGQHAWQIPYGNYLRYNYTSDRIELPLGVTARRKYLSPAMEQPIFGSGVLVLGRADGYGMILNGSTLKIIGEKKFTYGMNHAPVWAGNRMFFPNMLGNFAVKIIYTVHDSSMVTAGFKPAEAGIIVYREQLFFMEEGRRAKLLNIQTGKTVWEIPFSEQCITNPVFDGENIYLTFLNGDVVSLSWQQGNINWKIDCGTVLKNNVLLAGSSVYVFSKDGLWAEYKKDTGALSWKQDGMPPVVAPAAFDGEAIYIASLDHYLYIWDMQNKKILRKFSTGGILTAAPLVTPERIIVAGWDKKLYIFNKEGGTDWSHEFKHALKSSPLLIKDKLYVSVAGEGIYLYENTGSN